MKKIVLLLLCVLFITGCGHLIRNEREVNKYLRKNYPGERFYITSRENIEVPGDVGGCDSPGIGSSYKIKSLDTGIEFTLKDDYYFNSFVCEFRIDSDYLDIAKEKFINENKTSKMETYSACYSCFGLSFKRENYNTSEEMIEDVWNIIVKLNNTYPFKHKKIKNNVRISLDNENNIYDPFELNELYSKEKITEIVNSL